MTNTLLMRATALLEAQEKADQRQIVIAEYYARDKDNPPTIRMIKTQPDQDYIAEAVEVNNAEFFVLAANTSAEIITDYQDLVRRRADALTAAEVWTDPEYDVGEWREAAMQIRDEARAAIHHTPTNS
jgi:hypothetical protein